MIKVLIVSIIPYEVLWLDWIDRGPEVRGLGLYDHRTSTL